MVNSASFFVGWSWVVVLRDVAAVNRFVELRPFERVRAAFFGMGSSETVRTAVGMAELYSLGFVVFFGPVLTVLLIWCKGVALRAYSKVGGGTTRERLVHLLTKAAEEDSELSTKFGRRLLRLRREEDAKKGGAAAAFSSAAAASAPGRDAVCLM
eukprot:6347274-Prymnesium_polylepis.1